MEWWSTLFAFIQQEWLFLTWRDAIEIFFFSSVIYYFLTWLNHDKQKNLVFWFYGYCILTFGAYTAQLHTMSIALFTCIPLVLMLFILIHQQTLQKNFIALKNITPKINKKHSWLENLMQASLHAINKNREIICIIERTDSLEQFLTTSCTFNADITRELLQLLINTTSAKEPIAFWVNHTGRLITINPTWHVHLDETWTSDEIKTLHKWKQDALFITEKSDALIFTISPTTRLFDVITKGKTVNKISAGHAFNLIKKHNCNTDKEGEDNAYITAKNTTQQKFSEN